MARQFLTDSVNKFDSSASYSSEDSGDNRSADGAAAETDSAATEDDGPPDAELVQLSQDGDLDAFDRLVIRYRGRIYAMIMNMIHNDADAWDLTQDTFVKAWKALPKFEARANFFTWLYRICHNVTYDWLRKRSNKIEKAEFDDRIEAGSMEASAPTTPRASLSPDANAEHSELRQRIDEAIQQLSPEHREVILLKEVEGLSYQEIADTADCAIGTVMSRLHHARKKLQQTLNDLQP